MNESTPLLGSTVMVVVDAVEHVVLHVPAEGTEAHPDVEPGDNDALDGLVDVVEQALMLAGQLREVVHVPFMRGVRVIALPATRKAAADGAGVEVSSVVHLNRLLAALDNVPEFRLKLCWCRWITLHE